MIKCKFDSYYAIGKQYNVMVTYKAHDFIMIVRICLLHNIYDRAELGDSSFNIMNSPLKVGYPFLKKMNYSSMVEQSTHNGCISVQV